MAKTNPEQKAELNSLKSENMRLRQNTDGMREQMAQLQSKVILSFLLTKQFMIKRHIL